MKESAHPYSKSLQLQVIEPRKGWRIVNVREIFEFRDLLYFMVLREVSVLYNQTILGFGWAILNPLFSMVVFSVVFGKLAKVPTDGIPYPIFSFAALIPWTYFSSALTGSTNSLIQSASLFTKVYFPRIFIPLVPVFSKLVDLSIAVAVLIVMMLFYGIGFSARLFYLPGLILLMMLTAGGMGMWFSALAIQFRDVRHAGNFIIQVMMYAAPVVWPTSLIPGKYRLLYSLYPMAGVIEGFRAAFLGSPEMPWDLLSGGALAATIVFVSGALYFRRMESLFADIY